VTAVNRGPATAGQLNSAAVLVRANSEVPIPFGPFTTQMGSINPANAAPRWFNIGTVPFSYFATAATVNTLPLFWLPAGGMIHGIHLYPTQAFGGGAISTYTVSVGISTSVALLASALSVTSNLSTNFQLSSNFDAFDMGAKTQITITATSSGANLNAALYGTVSVKVMISSLTGT
jgi:hypothetical protein